MIDETLEELREFVDNYHNGSYTMPQSQRGTLIVAYSIARGEMEKLKQTDLALARYYYRYMKRLKDILGIAEQHKSETTLE